MLAIQSNIAKYNSSYTQEASAFKRRDFLYSPFIIFSSVKCHRNTATAKISKMIRQGERNACQPLGHCIVDSHRHTNMNVKVKVTGSEDFY